MAAVPPVVRPTVSLGELVRRAVGHVDTHLRQLADVYGAARVHDGLHGSLTRVRGCMCVYAGCRPKQKPSAGRRWSTLLPPAAPSCAACLWLCSGRRRLRACSSARCVVTGRSAGQRGRGRRSRSTQALEPQLARHDVALVHTADRLYFLQQSLQAARCVTRVGGWARALWSHGVAVTAGRRNSTWRQR
jgi:hypothetical protein